MLGVVATLLFSYFYATVCKAPATETTFSRTWIEMGRHPGLICLTLETQPLAAGWCTKRHQPNRSQCAPLFFSTPLITVYVFSLENFSFPTSGAVVLKHSINRMLGTLLTIFLGDRLNDAIGYRPHLVRACYCSRYYFQHFKVIALVVIAALGLLTGRVFDCVARTQIRASRSTISPETSATSF